MSAQMTFNHCDEKGKLEFWHVWFSLVTGVEVTSEGVVQMMAKAKENPEAKSDLEQNLLSDIRNYVQEQGVVPTDIKSVELESIGDHNEKKQNASLIVKVVPKARLGKKQISLLGNALFPLSYT